MNQETRSKTNLQKGVTVLFIVSTIIIGAGYFLEIINLSDHSKTLLVNNTASIIISYTLIIYTALANVMYGTFANEFTELRLNFFKGLFVCNALFNPCSPAYS